MFKTMLFIVIASLVSVIGCSDKPEAPLTGELRLYIQDGVADYDSVYLVIDSVYSFVNLDTMIKTLLLVGPDTVEIESLRNGRRFLLAGTDFPPGEIDGILIVFRNGRIVVNGASYDLNLPESPTPSLFPVNGRIIVNHDRIARPLLDIDLFASISLNESEEYYDFDPVMRLIDIDSSGTILGKTLPRADIFLFEHDITDTLAFTISEGDSLSFGFYGLPEGFYDMVCLPRGADTLSYTPLFNENIPVIAGEEYDMGLLELPSR
jgi:hypothetical protein